MEASAFQDLHNRLDSLLDVVKREKVKSEVREAQSVKLRLSIDDKQELNTTLLQVTELFKSMGGVKEQEVLEKLEEFVSYGLSAVFGASYSFITELITKGKDIRVEFQVKTADLQSDVSSAKGGGVAEVVSILIQIFVVVILKGSIAPVMFLDTALVHLSPQYHGNMSVLLREITTRAGIQIIMLANLGTYGESADVLYRFSQSDGKTIVHREK